METLEDTRVNRDELDRLRWAADVLRRLVLAPTPVEDTRVWQEAKEAATALELGDAE